MWTFEPSVARNIYESWTNQRSIKILRNEKLDRQKGGVIKSKSTARISSIRLLSNKQIRGKVFIDCTYEGDLMAAAEVSYTVGREAATTYSESLNGVQVGKRFITNWFVESTLTKYRVTQVVACYLTSTLRAQEPRALRTIAYKPTAFECA